MCVCSLRDEPPHYILVLVHTVVNLLVQKQRLNVYLLYCYISYKKKNKQSPFWVFPSKRDVCVCVLLLPMFI